MAATIHIEVTNAGGNIVLDGTNFSDGTVVEVYAASGVVLANNFHLEVYPSPIDGTTVYYQIGLNTDLDLNGNTFDISGQYFSQEKISAYGVFRGFWFFDSTFIGGGNFYSSFVAGGYLDGAQLLDGSIPFSAMPTLNSGKIIVGSGANRAADVSLSGDATLSNTGALTIANSAITNAKVSASAAIALSKLAPLTASKVAVTDISGVITTANQVSPALGGTGQDTSASTGFATVSAGTWSIGSISDVITLDVSFETGELGDFKIKIPYACTVTEIYAYAYKAIAATDNGTIVPKNNGGTTMTSGTITFTASDARGTAYTASPSANNTFSAGDLLTLTTAKTTAGGKVLVSIKVTRTL